MPTRRRPLKNIRKPGSSPQGRAGAELCCVGPQSWQFRVARRRKTSGTVQLLRQHYLYSWVDDGYDKDTIENGAAALRVDAYWLFFWT